TGGDFTALDSPEKARCPGTPQRLIPAHGYFKTRVSYFKTRNSTILKPTIQLFLKPTIQQGMAQLGLADRVEIDLVNSLLAYLDLLQRWNKVCNLTAVRDPEQMVYRHILDSLAIGPHLGSGVRCIDVGSGAGLPGVPLAIVYPEREFHLLDSNGKKTRFLFQVKTELGLDNITVHNSRAETFVAVRPYDIVLSRAFASLIDMVESCMHLCAADGCFLAMKGLYPEQELVTLDGRCQLVAAHRIQVPGLPEQRHLIELRPVPGVNGEILG
ncbi:MAG: 16S rRNA (guanine(527)-N(7))-methyltransferase RsmG, partial [Gammaproteobacteria bacterium]|nr:16S rRNA (guanine(527)-N(7))-methyltransferase RsmG [Gammaproteobacteria bacterium]